MYVRLARLRRFAASDPEAELGSIDTLYFDQDDWAVRLISLLRRDRAGNDGVLISPIQVREVSLSDEQLRLRLDAGAYSHADPGQRHRLDSAATTRVLEHYGLPEFWNGTRVWGDFTAPDELARGGSRRAPTDRTPADAEPADSGPDSTEGEPAGGQTGPPQLFPHTMLMGRGVFAPDSRLGVISDLLVDIRTWRIRYLIVWVQAPGESGEILLSPYWVSGPPRRRRVTVPMTTEAIVSGPNFEPEELEPIDERILAHYYGFLTEQ